MYEISPKFLHADGSIYTMVTCAEGHKARAEAMRQGCEIVSEMIGRLLRSDKKASDAALRPSLSAERQQA